MQKQCNAMFRDLGKSNDANLVGLPVLSDLLLYLPLPAKTHRRGAKRRSGANSILCSNPTLDETSAPRDVKSSVSKLKISGNCDTAKFAATSFDAEVERNANSVPPFETNSAVSPRSFMPRQKICMLCASSLCAATARSFLTPSSQYQVVAANGWGLVHTSAPLTQISRAVNGMPDEVASGGAPLRRRPA